MRPPHEIRLLEMTEQEFNQWRHNPVTSAYLAYLEDQVEAFRMAAADLLENGLIERQADVLRGRILTLRELHGLKIEHIHNFYRNEAEVRSGSGNA